MAVAFVQSEKNTGHNASSAAKAFTSNNTAGNCLVVAVGVWKSGGAFNDPTITDTLGNTWVLLLSTPRVVSCAYLFVCYNCLAGANTVTVNVGTSSDIDFAIHEYSGVATVTARDQIMGGAQGNAVTSIFAGTIQTQFANEVIFSFAYDQQHGTQTFTPSAGWTSRQQTANAGAESLATYDQIASSTGSFTNTIGISGGTSQGLHAIIATFADTSSTDDLVQLAKANSSSTSSLGVAFASNNASGNLLLIAIGRWVSGTLGTITSVTDTRGNTWVLVGSTTIAASSGNSQAHVYACLSCAAGANTVTVATSSAQDLNLIALEYTPGSITTAVTNRSITGTTVASGNANADPGLAFCIAYNQSSKCGNYSDSSGTGWKQRANQTDANATTMTVFDQILAATSTIESTITSGIGSNGLHVIVSGKLPTTQPIMMFLIS